MNEKLSVGQKMMLLVLYLLLVLMIIFSIGSTSNKGKEGFNKCIQSKCDAKGEEFCTKQREINNCCLGSGGELAMIENKLSCIFT